MTRHRYLTVEEMQGELRLRSPVTVQRMCRRGEIPGAKKIAGRWLVHEPTFRQWLAKPEPPDPPDSFRQPIGTAPPTLKVGDILRNAGKRKEGH